MSNVHEGGSAKCTREARALSGFRPGQSTGLCRSVTWNSIASLPFHPTRLRMLMVLARCRRGFSYEMKNGVNVSYQTRSVGASISPQSLGIATLSNPRLRK